MEHIIAVGCGQLNIEALIVTKKVTIRVLTPYLAKVDTNSFLPFIPFKMTQSGWETSIAPPLEQQRSLSHSFDPSWKVSC